MRARVLSAVLVSVALAAVAPGARAENDPYGVITDPDGHRWASMSMSEFLALPAVEAVESAALSRASGDFRAGDARATDDDPRPRWTVVQDGRVTRFLERRGTTRSVVYVGPARECRRTAVKGTPSSIASDRTSDFTCRARKAGTADGIDYVRGFLPSALVDAGLPPDPRVLVPEEDLGVPADDARLRVIIRSASLLRTLGLYGGPGVYATYDVTTTGIYTEVDVSNGTSTMLLEFALSTLDAPDLPRVVARQVR